MAGCWGLEVERERLLDPCDAVEGFVEVDAVERVISIGSEAILGVFLVKVFFDLRVLSLCPGRQNFTSKCSDARFDQV